MPNPRLDIGASLLFDAVAASNVFSADAIDYPDVAFTPPRAATADGTTPLPYVSVSFTPNTSELDGISFSSGLNNDGLLGLNVIVPSGQGAIIPIQLAQQLVAAFSPGTVLLDSASGVQVRINEQPRISGPMEGAESLIIPVIVRWVIWTPASGG